MRATLTLQDVLSRASAERQDRARRIISRGWLRDVRVVGALAQATCAGLVGVRVRVDLATFDARCECVESAPCDHALALMLLVHAQSEAAAPPARAEPVAQVATFEARTMRVELDARDPGRLVLASADGRRAPERAIESLRWLWWRRDERERLSGEARTLPQATRLLHEMGLAVEGPRADDAWRGACATFHQRALGESVTIRILDAASDAALALAETLAARGAHPHPGALPYDTWTLPPEAGFASWFLDAWSHRARVVPDPTLNPKPLHGVEVQLDPGCLPARLVAPQNEEIERFLRRAMGSLPSRDAHGHVLIPATRVVDVEEGLRALGADVQYRRLAPAGLRYLEWPAHAPEDLVGRRPRLREPFTGTTAASPPGLRANVTLADYQREAVAFLLHHDHTCLLADDMGLGKTLEAIAAAQFLPGRILVVAPASAREVWRREIEKFTTETAAVLGPGASPADALGSQKYVVTGYSNLEALGDALADTSFDLVVLDESHYVKNAATGRARIVRDKLQPIPRRLVVSGTPVMNTPDEVRAQLAFLHPDEWSDGAWFKRRFAEPFAEGSPEVRSAVLARLRQFLEGVMLRREKAEALPDLPAKEIRWHRVALAGEARRAYVALESDFESFAATGGDSALASAKATGKIERLKQAALAGKLPAIVAFARDLVERGEKVVLFSRYRNAIKSLAAELADAGAVTLTGDSSPDERADAELRFQTDASCRVFIGQLVAAGTALTLVAGTHAVFTDLDWNPANHRQAMDRIHRRGQTRPVTVHFFLAQETVDEDVALVLDAKGQMMDALLAPTGATSVKDARRLVARRVIERRQGDAAERAA